MAEWCIITDPTKTGLDRHLVTSDEIEVTANGDLLFKNVDGVIAGIAKGSWHFFAVKTQLKLTMSFG